MAYEATKTLALLRNKKTRRIPFFLFISSLPSKKKILQKKSMRTATVLTQPYKMVCNADACHSLAPRLEPPSGYKVLEAGMGRISHPRHPSLSTWQDIASTFPFSKKVITNIPVEKRVLLRDERDVTYQTNNDRHWNTKECSQRYENLICHCI